MGGLSKKSVCEVLGAFLLVGFNLGVEEYGVVKAPEPPWVDFKGLDYFIPNSWHF